MQMLPRTRRLSNGLRQRRRHRHRRASSQPPPAWRLLLLRLLALIMRPAAQLASARAIPASGFRLPQRRPTRPSRHRRSHLRPSRVRRPAPPAPSEQRPHVDDSASSTAAPAVFPHAGRPVPLLPVQATTRPAAPPVPRARSESEPGHAHERDPRRALDRRECRGGPAPRRARRAPRGAAHASHDSGQDPAGGAGRG